MRTDGFVAYRSVVFGLALGYWLYQFKAAFDGSGFGWQFRYLTIWALTASLLSAWLCLCHGRGLGAPPHLVASVAMVMNGLVVVLYWRLYFTDPALVNNGTPVWWQEFYLHLVGPLLQWIEALVLLGAFRAPWRVLAAMVALIASYIAWIEGVVQPLNALPVGTVTSGLPYPFLNSMVLSERLAFYQGTALLALVFIAVGVAATWLRRRVR